MTAETDSMTLNEVSVPALGVEERSDEAPRSGRARPNPDPEVVAKPNRRQFIAEYRLRILEEADRCTQPGEVGRMLRREGLYSSHLTAWRKARRKGSLRELAAKKRGAKPAERNPLDAKVRALEAQVARLEHELHTAQHDPGRAGKSCRAAGIEPRTRNALFDCGPTACCAFKRGADLPSTWRVTWRHRQNRDLYRGFPAMIATDGSAVTASTMSGRPSGPGSDWRTFNCTTSGTLVH